MFTSGQWSRARQAEVKVFGAGSIGNHRSHAARRLGWAVDVVDRDPAALKRMQTEIYPGRYGSWDDGIRQFAAAAAPSAGYDLICVGTPPDSHSPALRSLRNPRAVLVEKPLCGPDLHDAQAVADEAKAFGVAVFVGYDHVVGRGARSVAELLRQRAIGTVETIDVEFREHWGGIFAAHPWLAAAGAAGIAAPFRRPEGISGDRLGDLDVLAHALRARRTDAVTTSSSCCSRPRHCGNWAMSRRRSGCSSSATGVRSARSRRPTARRIP